MFRSLLLVPAAAALLAVCDPSAPADPEPVTPPEQASVSGLPDLPDSQDSAGADQDTSAPPQLDEDERAEMDAACSTVTADGMCNISFGMTPDEAREAFPSELYGGPDANPACYYLRPSATDYGRAFMVVDEKIQRIDIRDDSVETLLGARVGLPLDEVEAMYEDTTRTPNKYAPGNDDLKADLGDGVFAVFETDNSGSVRAFRVGVEPPVDYVEGCG